MGLEVLPPPPPRGWTSNLLHLLVLVGRRHGLFQLAPQILAASDHVLHHLERGRLVLARQDHVLELLGRLVHQRVERETAAQFG